MAPAPAPGRHTVYFVQEREKVPLRVAPSNGLLPAPGDDFHLVRREEASPCGMSQTLGTEGRWGPPEPGGGIVESPQPGAPHSCTVSQAGFPVPDEEGGGVWGSGGHREYFTL